jgi:1,2-diacylglycerol 3-beta-glucosyltransferase
MTTILVSLLIALALPVSLACAYLFAATILSRAVPAPAGSARRLRFDVVVPAHNEASSIARTVSSLLRLDWPREQFRVLVVAHNCSDDTAGVAHTAGADVLERNDPSEGGKGYALDFAFSVSASQGWADAVAVVDADSQASANLLESMAARLENGADAVQVHYGSLNPNATWRTRLMTIAMASFHGVRSRARERLALSCGIRGNGWCVTHRILTRVPYRAYSLAEDVEYGLRLGLAGCRVHYAEESHVNGEMASSARLARSQRQRWEIGRLRLIRTLAIPLLRSALRSRRPLCLDLALDLLVPPLSYVVLGVAALSIASGLACRSYPSLSGWLWFCLADWLALLLYVFRGWWLSGTGLGGALALVHAPVFLIWKVLVMSTGHRTKDWVRTGRESS